MDNEPFSHGPLEQFSEPGPQRTPYPDPPRSPCSSCSTLAILSDIGFCCDCQYELTILKHLRENKPVYLLADTIAHYTVTSIQKTSDFSYSVKVHELSSEIHFVQLTDFHLSIPSLVTAGIAKANDAILRFNSLHKQHLATNP